MPAKAGLLTSSTELRLLIAENVRVLDYTARNRRRTDGIAGDLQRRQEEPMSSLQGSQFADNAFLVQRYGH
jgi:hypothetical protein